MAKITRGRISGIDGMQSHTYVELFAWAEKLRAQASAPDNKDDPKWLLRQAEKLHSLGVKKEKARAQKAHKTA